VGRLAKVLVVLLGLATLAVATDRLALLVWRARVVAYSRALETAVAKSTLGAPAVSEQPLLCFSHGRGEWQVPLLEVVLRGPTPEMVTVDGNGGLNLLYVPPLLAWSRHVPWVYQRRVIQPGDTYPYNDIYLLKVWTVEDRHGGGDLPQPKVQLDHGFPF
jgi:hypothetical protein